MKLSPVILAVSLVSAAWAGHQTPEEAKAHLEHGDTLYHQGDFDGAVAEFREAIRLQPDDSEARRSLDLALLKKTTSIKSPGTAKPFVRNLTTPRPTSTSAGP